MKTASPFIKADPHGGPCVACQTPTDTILAVKGDPEWHAAFLVILGVPTPAAMIMIEQFGTPDFYRVCSACVAKTPFPPPAISLPGADVPRITQPTERN